MSKQESRPEVLQGTLDLMVLRTLETMGPQHGLGLAKRIEQISEGTLSLNQGTLYPALLRLQQKGWIDADWGTSDNNRRARFYRLTAAGRRRIAKEEASWTRTVSLMSRFLRGDQEG
jgi:PadR family transcriptional regulator, regulatory protein PadR